MSSLCNRKRIFPSSLGWFRSILIAPESLKILASSPELLVFSGEQGRKTIFAIMVLLFLFFSVAIIPSVPNH